MIKYIVTFCLLVFSTQVRAQASAEKKYSDSTGNYVIHYDYDDSWAFDPLVGKANPHFSAYVTVYKINPMKKKVLIGDSMTGNYVPNGCYEDNPAEWVKKALASVLKTGTKSQKK